ncbi:MAG: DUF4936 family protein [Burkholderiales bacterium]|nr:DUF4936 family protein [Burkholderiales bacterium]
MSVALYVYYRVAAAEDAAARTLVRAVQDDVREATGVSGRLLCRRDDPGTWMEVYEGIEDPVAFERALETALARRGFAALLAPGAARHTERFVAL